MIAWLVKISGLSPLVVKIVLLGLAAGGIWASLRWYGNRQWYKGEAAGRRYEAKQLEKSFLEKEKALKADIAQQRTSLASEKSTVARARVQVDQERKRNAEALSGALALIQKQQTINNETIANIPASELDSSIRTISAELAANR